MAGMMVVMLGENLAALRVELMVEMLVAMMAV